MSFQDYQDAWCKITRSESFEQSPMWGTVRVELIGASPLLRMNRLNLITYQYLDSRARLARALLAQTSDPDEIARLRVDAIGTDVLLLRYNAEEW